MSNAAPDPEVGIDAEAWLKERGITREAFRVAPPVASGPGALGTADRAARTPVSVREAVRLATEIGPAARGMVAGDAPADPGSSPAADAVAEAVRESLADEVARAMGYVRRATASTPLSEGRLRSRLAERDFSGPAIEMAIERARTERHVDDPALARALAEEGLAKGHAPARVRRDLRKRELPADLVDTILEEVTPADLEAAAFDVAQVKARASRAASPEAAFRRVVGHLARRGYPLDLARRVARQAVLDDREPDRVAGH